MRKLNKALAGLMAAVVVLAGASVSPVEANAAGTTIYYDDGTANDVNDEKDHQISAYWGKGTDGENLVPVEDGYVFGGWYTANTDGTYTPIKQADIASKGVGEYSTAVAKFVPSYVLSVKMQINSTTEKENGALPLGTGEDMYTNMRLLSAVDSVKYQNVGFDIVLDKNGYQVPSDTTKYTKVYKTLNAVEGEGKTSLDASTTFGSPATHFIAAELSNIVADNLDKIIYVTPYWTTIDGTKVEGASKFIRVMDGYAENKYISIPVNILTNVNAAAGMVEMTYPTSLKCVEWEEGVLYTEMAANTATAGTIKFVGNGDKVDATYMTGEEIYANVWFQYTGDLKTLTRNSLEFTMDTESFCSWDEELLSTVKAWDVLY